MSGAPSMTMTEVKHHEMPDGTILYALKTTDGRLVETRDESVRASTPAHGGRRVFGLSCMSGCPVRCTFCATGTMKNWRNLTAREIVDQVRHATVQRPVEPVQTSTCQFKYSGMGEPFLNVSNVRQAIAEMGSLFPGSQHLISTIGIKGSDFSWIRDPVTLNLSVHSLRDDRRRRLVPDDRCMTLAELGSVVTPGPAKIQVTFAFADDAEYDLDAIEKIFDPEKFSIRTALLTPI